jgi:hypothetical protein
MLPYIANSSISFLSTGSGLTSLFLVISTGFSLILISGV